MPVHLLWGLAVARAAGRGGKPWRRGPRCEALGCYVHEFADFCEHAFADASIICRLPRVRAPLWREPQAVAASRGADGAHV